MPQFAIQKPSQIRQCATSKLLGRSTASTGPVEELTATTAKGVLGLADTDSPTFAGITTTGNITVGDSNDAKLTFNGSTYGLVRSGTGVGFLSNNTTRVMTKSDRTVIQGIYTGSTPHYFGFSDTTTADTSAGDVDVRLQREGANNLSLTNGVNSNQFSVTNTWSDTSNFERLALRWSGNVAIIDTQSSGTGSTRDLDIMRNGSRKIRFGSTVKFYASLRFNSNSYDIGERVNLSAPRHVYINQSFNCGNSSTAGSVTVNNLWDDSTNFETLKFSWDSNTAKIGTVADGTGSVRPLEIHGGDLTLSAANIQITNLPTSDPGVANQIWNDSGTLKISAG